MKFLIFFILLGLVYPVKAQSQNTDCFLDDPVRTIQKFTVGYKYSLNFLKCKNSLGECPAHCEVYKLKYRKNGTVKDSSLHKVISWNEAGLKTLEISYSKNGNAWLKEKIIYEKVGNDSIVTLSRGGYLFEKYFLNEKNQVYRRVVYKDSSFNAINFEEQIEFDALDHISKISVLYTSSSSRSQVMTWEYDSLKTCLEVYWNGELSSTVKANLDSCYVYQIFEKSNNYLETKYFYNSNQEITRIQDLCQTKKGEKVFNMNYERNPGGEIIHQFGSSELEKYFDFKVTYHAGGLKSSIKYLSENLGFHYYYKF